MRDGPRHVPVVSVTELDVRQVELAFIVDDLQVHDGSIAFEAGVEVSVPARTVNLSVGAHGAECLFKEHGYSSIPISMRDAIASGISGIPILCAHARVRSWPSSSLHLPSG